MTLIRNSPSTQFSAQSSIDDAVDLTTEAGRTSEVELAHIGGSTLRDLRVSPIPFVLARDLVVRHHYLHTMPGGTQLTLGVFSGQSVSGVITLGAGPANAHCLVDGAAPADCLTLTRMWLDAGLPCNSESRAIGLLLRALRRHTSLKFLLTYADPSAGHVGAIYQASNFLYSGLSAPMPLYDLGDGINRHSRSLAHAYGSHSTRFFESQGLQVTVAQQPGKHRYVCFLDPAWKGRLLVPVLPYPKKGTT